MSLHNLANEIQKKGRGDDRMLVHMTPKEVAGLQAIAKAHGGSLTVNPDTGLVEAGFLKNLMPMIIGAGLTAATGGAAAPWMVGLGYGAFETARTGDIGKGLMAGLSAYGAGSLGTGLEEAGAEVIGQEALPMAQQQGTQALVEAGFNPTTTNMSAQQMSELASKGIINPQQAEAYGKAFAESFPQSGAMQNLSSMGAGLGQVGGQFLMNNAGNIAMTAAPMLMDEIGRAHV